MSAELDSAVVALNAATDAATQQTTAVQSLTENVSGKIGEIDARLNDAITAINASYTQAFTAE